MRRMAAGLAMVLLVLSGCSSLGREPDRMALVRVLAVDGARNAVLTAVCGEDQRGMALGEDFETARVQIPWGGEREELSLTGVSYLVVGKDVKLTDLLIAVLEDAELGGTATVWVAADSGSALLSRCKDPAVDLELLCLQGVSAPTVAEAAGTLACGHPVELPVVDEQNGHIVKRGTMWWGENS